LTANLTKSCHFDKSLIYYGAMGKSISPISEKTFSRFSNFIDDVINRNECGSIIGLTQREHGYRINQLKNRATLKIVDLKSYFLDDPEDIELSEINNKRLSCFLITNADCLLEEKQAFLTYFNDLVRKNKNLSLIFFFQHNITYPWNMKALSPYQYLFQNILFYPKYNQVDPKQFLFYIEQKLKTKVSVHIKNLILKECGGDLWLIKEAVRYYAKTKNTKNLFDHEEMIFRLKVTYNELEEQEKQVFKKFIKQEVNFTDEENTVLSYLETSNIISPLLSKFISQQTVKENNLSLGKDQKIFLNSFPVDYFFSKTEKKGLRFFLNQTSRLITRNQLGTILWNDSDFSDWALDQFIKRLRNKLIKLGLDRQLIKTKKNQGFVFNNHYVNL